MYSRLCSNRNLPRTRDRRTFRGVKKIRDSCSGRFRYHLFTSDFRDQDDRHSQYQFWRKGHERSLSEPLLPLRGLRLQRKDVKTCRRKALRHDRICSLPPDHLSGCSRCCDRSPDQLKSAPRSSVFFRSDVRWCWYRICLWSDLRGLGCTGCYNDRCCGRYSW